MLTVTEIFASIQGETSYSGYPFAFVRLSGCNLRCGYCDTSYAYEPGAVFPLEEVVARSPWWLTGLVWAGMMFLIVITQGTGNAFIYFQF